MYSIAYQTIKALFEGRLYSSRTLSGRPTAAPGSLSGEAAAASAGAGPAAAQTGVLRSCRTDRIRPLLRCSQRSQGSAAGRIFDFLPPKSAKRLPIRKKALYLHSQSANGALVQLVRIRACHARGQGFESPTHRGNKSGKPCKRIVCKAFSFPARGKRDRRPHRRRRFPLRSDDLRKPTGPSRPGRTGSTPGPPADRPAEVKIRRDIADRKIIRTFAHRSPERRKCGKI